MLDFSNVEAKTYQPLTPGTYQFYIEKSEIKTSQAGNDYISLELSCTNPDHEGKKVYDTINHAHKDEKVREISESKIKQILLSMGSKKFAFDNWYNLIDSIQSGIVWAEVGIKKEPGYAEKNVVKYYKTVDRSVTKTEDFVNPAQDKNIPF